MRKIIANIGWIFFDKIFRMVVGMLVSIWVARYLGPAKFGILNYAMLFPTIFLSIANFGLTNVLMVELTATDSERLKQNLVKTGLFIKLTAGFTTYIISCSLNYIFNKNNQELFYLINITGLSLVLQSSDVIETFFQAHTKAKLSVIVKVIAFIGASSIRVYALLTQKGITFFAIVNIVELIVAYALMLLVYSDYVTKSLDKIKSVVDFRSIKELINVGWPIMLTEFFIFVYMKIDQFMIESLSNNKELGLYGAALRLSETWYFIATAITTSFYPKIATTWLTDRALFYKQYQALLNVLTYISVTLAIGISFSADRLIDIVYGQKFAGAGHILSIHIWAGVFVFMGVGVTNLMTLKDLQKFVLIKTIIGAIVNIILNFWLIPDFGALGASIATLISYSLSVYGINLLYNQSRPVFYLQSKSFINFLSFKNPLN